MFCVLLLLAGVCIVSMSMTACPNRRCKCSTNTLHIQIINTKK